jgi:hypothetical protein
MSISKDTLNQIEAKKIKPKPKWQFLLKNYLIWSIAGIAALIGSLAMAVIIYIAVNRDWFLYSQKIHRPPLGNFLLDLPIIWIILLLIVVFIALYDVRHSKTGYKYSVYLIVIGSLLIIFVCGIIGHYFGLGAGIDKRAGQKIPFYRSIEKQTFNLWTEVENGHLGGKFVRKIDDNTIEIRDLAGKTWQVDITNIENPLFKEGEKLKIIGDKTDDNTFKAQDIHFWSDQKFKQFFNIPR